MRLALDVNCYRDVAANEPRAREAVEWHRLGHAVAEAVTQIMGADITHLCFLSILLDHIAQPSLTQPRVFLLREK